MPGFTRRDLLRSTAVSGLAFSASAVLARSAWARTEALIASSDATLPSLPPREKLLFDFGWKF